METHFTCLNTLFIGLDLQLERTCGELSCPHAAVSMPSPVVKHSHSSGETLAGSSLQNVVGPVQLTPVSVGLYSSVMKMMNESAVHQCD